MGKVEVYFKSNYWEIYPILEEIAIKSIKKISHGICLELIPLVKNFSHFLISISGEEYKASKDGLVTIKFKGEEVRRRKIKVKVVTKDGYTSRDYYIEVSYYPSSFYKRYGKSEPTWVIIHTSDLSLYLSRVEDWIVEEINEEDRQFIEKKWGYLVKQSESDYETACKIAKSLIDELEPHRGVPSDYMEKLSPLEQYKSAISGKGRVWCSNIASIFSYICNALDIPCRKIILGHRIITDESSNIGVLIAEGHTTTEIFSKDLNQWIWIDPTCYILGAYLKDIGPLNLIETYMFVNNPARLKYLYIIEYDPSAKVEKRVRVLESIRKHTILNYLKRDQVFKYVRKY